MGWPPPRLATRAPPCMRALLQVFPSCAPPPGIGVMPKSTRLRAQPAVLTVVDETDGAPKTCLIARERQPDASTDGDTVPVCTARSGIGVAHAARAGRSTAYQEQGAPPTRSGASNQGVSDDWRLRRLVRRNST